MRWQGMLFLWLPENIYVRSSGRVGKFKDRFGAKWEQIPRKKKGIYLCTLPIPGCDSCLERGCL